MTPPRPVLAAFGTSGPAVELSGGMAPAYRVGDIVLKRAGEPVEAGFAADVMAAVEVDERRVRVARPVAADDGRWIVDGWSATTFVEGQRPDRGQPWATALDAAAALHDGLRAVPPVPMLAARTHRWAVAERVAWGEEEVELDPRIAAMAEGLWPHISTPAAPAQLLHGDLCGNLLFHPTLPPAVIDFSPMWRSPGFSLAIYVSDALGWHGGDDALLDLIGTDADIVACLARAGVFRLVALHGRIRDLDIPLEPLLPEYGAMIDRLVAFLG